ncbi:hypothetical protein BDV95DRAFT_582025, partial [Massariosphaeria phaeospora]
MQSPLFFPSYLLLISSRLYYNSEISPMAKLFKVLLPLICFIGYSTARAAIPGSAQDIEALQYATTPRALVERTEQAIGKPRTLDKRVAPVTTIYYDTRKVHIQFALSLTPAIAQALRANTRAVGEEIGQSLVKHLTTNANDFGITPAQVGGILVNVYYSRIQFDPGEAPYASFAINLHNGAGGPMNSYMLNWGPLKAVLKSYFEEGGHNVETKLVTDVLTITCTNFPDAFVMPPTRRQLGERSGTCSGSSLNWRGALAPYFSDQLLEGPVRIVPC